MGGPQASLKAVSLYVVMLRSVGADGGPARKAYIYFIIITL